VVAIPEVEYHINTELSTSPTPTSRRVGVPPPKSRAGVTIPHQHRSERERHVQIFDSQPLSSPPSRSGSANNSLNTSAGAAATLHAKIQKLALSSSMKPTTNDLPPIEVTPVDKKEPVIESPNSSPVSVISSPSSIHATCQSNESTPPTSLGSHGARTVLSRLAVLSAKEQLKLKAEEHEEKEKLKRLDRKRSPERISLPVSKNTSPVKEEPVPVPSAPIGPSLLSQTDPRRSETHSPASSNSSSPSSSPQKPSTIFPTPSFTPRPALFELPISVKIADLGNASDSTKHYTEDIQTRQYRSPEAIIGRKDWGARADIWSVACVIFELLTAEYLFDPQSQGQLFTKDDDHMAQIIELMGDFSLEAKMGGKYSRELFDHTGALRYIRTLKPWPLKRVMMEKYLYKEKDAMALCDFLEPMLAVDQRDRKEARDMVNHPWMDVDEDEWIEDW
jgi:serine/threonine-protein kinase SRPK3